MAAVLGEEDSVDSHVHDTVDAGAGLCHAAIVRLVAERGPACVDWLCAQGVRFTPADGRGTTSPYHLTREGGHSQRRVVHVADATGRAICDVLVARPGPTRASACWNRIWP